MIILSFGFSMLFCSSNNQNNISGIYRSPKNTKTNQFLFGTFVTELELNLKSDSTYTMTTCAQNIKGIWKLKESKVILICEEKKMIIDSLNNLQKFAKGKICGNDEIFNITDGKLSRKDKIGMRDINFILLKN
ncbi:hypothetical protein [Chryseobacterium luquanense]|uniref:Lipocalin-like domain-containing protein n=1 Tax=Chryseobacterium luquanense TaxID=2983766 RepID=A0ABT3Y094_9FLAO|nr:hypothetical protein [Chryseobacterium luquanense]MCX8531552.1 hypothetical protein [Chryseobacterium luquanense]